MDVYVVWRDNYKNYGILGVALDEKAANYMAEMHRDSSKKPVVQKFKVFSESDIPRKRYYLVVGNRDKYLLDKPKCYIVGENEKELDEEGYELSDLCNVNEYCVGKGEYAVNLLDVVVESDSSESAIDLAIELFQEYENRKEGE